MVLRKLAVQLYSGHRGHSRSEGGGVFAASAARNLEHEARDALAQKFDSVEKLRKTFGSAVFADIKQGGVCAGATAAGMKKIISIARADDMNSG